MIESKDLEDVRLSRPVSVTDLWDIDDRIDRLQDVAIRLERVVEALIELYRSERIKNWELILKQMLKAEEEKQRGHNDSRTFGTKPKVADPERPL
jgi:hypothetical protein